MRAVDHSRIDALDGTIDVAAQALLRAQRPDGHWVFAGGLHHQIAGQPVRQP